MRIAILTSGGDAPGMNAAIWGAVGEIAAAGGSALGIAGGLPGLLAGEARGITPEQAARAARHGGSWLGTGRLPDFEANRAALIGAAARLELDGLVILGGDGSLRAAAALAEDGLAVAAIPATIDNDIAATRRTLGFATALETGLMMADRLRDTAEALPRLFSLETLGGPTGYLAEALARLTRADLLLVPEIRGDRDEEAARLSAAIAARGHALIVASEGVAGLEARLQALAEAAGTRLRHTRLGHAQRGGAPVAADRALALASAEAAVAALTAGRGGVMVLDGTGAVRLLPFAEAALKRPPFPAGWRGLL